MDWDHAKVSGVHISGVWTNAFRLVPSESVQYSEVSRSTFRGSTVCAYAATFVLYAFTNRHVMLLKKNSPPSPISNVFLFQRELNLKVNLSFTSQSSIGLYFTLYRTCECYLSSACMRRVLSWSVIPLLQDRL